MTATTNKNGASKIPTPPTQEEISEAKVTLRGHEDWVSSVVFIPRTNLLVTSSADKTLRVWDLDTGKQVGKPLLNHDCAVWRVAASPDGRWIVSGGWNGSILVWEVATDKTDIKREPVSFKGHEILLRSLAFAPDSETFASASNDLTVCVWKRETGTIVLGPLRLDALPNLVLYSLRHGFTYSIELNVTRGYSAVEGESETYLKAQVNWRKFDFSESGTGAGAATDDITVASQYCIHVIPLVRDQCEKSPWVH